MIVPTCRSASVKFNFKRRYKNSPDWLIDWLTLIFGSDLAPHSSNLSCNTKWEPSRLTPLIRKDLQLRAANFLTWSSTKLLNISDEHQKNQQLDRRLKVEGLALATGRVSCTLFFYLRSPHMVLEFVFSLTNGDCELNPSPWYATGNSNILLCN